MISRKRKEIGLEPTLHLKASDGYIILVEWRKRMMATVASQQPIQDDLGVEQEAAESEPTSSSPSSSSSLSPLPSDSKQTMDGTTRHQQLKSHRLFGNQYKSRIIDQSTLLKARPRIYASKSQNTASLLQSKYNKDESIARQRLLERRTQYFAKSDSGRLKAALDATFGAFRPDQKTFTKEDSTASTAEDLIAEHRRIRAINRSFDKVDWESEQTVSDRRPAWLRTK
ncbi:hypothetical protein BGW38_010506, partial [Lunasporangiospora selenospora]